MPERRCAIAGCNSNAADRRKNNLKISFHRFPKNKNIREEWLLKCRRKDSFNLDTACMCSIHFAKEDFNTSLQSILTRTAVIRTLKSGVIPSLHLYTNKKTTQTSSIRNKKLEVRGVKKFSEKLSHPSSFMEKEERENMEEKESIYNISDQPQLEICDVTHGDKYNNLLKEYQSLKTTYTNLDSDHIILRTNLTKAIKEFNDEEALRKSIEVILKRSFSKAQIDTLLKTKKEVEWSNTDMSNAFALRYISKECYFYLRDTLNYPLPPVDTLKKWSSQLKYQDGMLVDV